MIRVLVVDDHRLVRQGLRALLASAPDIEVVGEARDGREAIDMATDIAPNIILMDVEMPRLGGLQATEAIQALDLASRIIILSMYSDETLVRQAMRNGARGYLLKSADRDELISTIRSVNEGNTYFGSLLSDGGMDVRI
ncbi:MAG TPA: response regulator transcription factor [Anaerolineae bacterium]